MRSFYLNLAESGPDSPLSWGFYLLLWPISFLYGVIARLRGVGYQWGLFKSYRSTVPVISVGNITTGGTGKTPVVDAIVKHLISQGRRVAVVSRGYKGTYAGDFCRVSAELEPAVTGDEPYLLARRNPDAEVYVARKRQYAVSAAEAAGADCVILDDGFQHFGVHRDLDIVLLDGRNPFGNGSLLPAGNLREKPGALLRAGLVIVTHADRNSLANNPDMDYAFCRHRLADHLIDLHGERYIWDQVSGKNCLAFAGIARPEDFFAKLREAGCELKASMPFADHQSYDADTLRSISNSVNRIDFLLTTEKDAVKLKDVNFPVPCLAVPLSIEFDDFSAVAEKLDRLFGARRE